MEPGAVVVVTITEVFNFQEPTKGVLQSPPTFSDSSAVSHAFRSDISASAGTVLLIKFERFDIEASDADPHCKHGNLTFYSAELRGQLDKPCNVKNLQFPSLGVYCNGHRPPVELLIDSNDVIAEFCTDGSVAGKGFVAHWAAVDNYQLPLFRKKLTSDITVVKNTKSTNAVCGGDIILKQNETQVVTSPDFEKGAYPANTNCSWTIQTPTQYLQLKSLVFSVEGYTMDCFYDRLTVTFCDKYGGHKVVNYCGSRLTSGPDLMINNTHNCSLTMHFHSDADIQQRGFKLQLWAFTAIFQEDYNVTVEYNQPATIYSPGYPMAYIHRCSFRYFLSQNLGPDNVFLLKFFHFDLRDNEDFLKIYSKPWFQHQFDDDQSWLLHYTGVIPSTYSAEISARTLEILFTSVSGMVYDHSFKIEITLQKLGTCPPGKFRCKTGDTCVPVKWFCNGVPDCPDGSDENNNFCQGYSYKTCGESHVTPNIVPTDRNVGTMHPAKRGSWPWTVNLFLPGYYPFCDGTLISKKWVLTSASCFQQRNSYYGKYYVRIGGFNVEEEEEPGRYEVQIAAAFINPRFTFLSGVPLNDTMLLELAQEVPLGEHINVACLPYIYNYAVPDGINCVSTGWAGLAGTEYPMEPQEIVVRVVNNSQCGELAKLPPDQIWGTMCSTNQNSIESCYGNPGGPLTCKNYYGKWFLQGITSYVGCYLPQPSPVVYNRVPAFLPFIYDTVIRND